MLYAVYTVDTIDMVYTVVMAYTVEMVYTVDMVYTVGWDGWVIPPRARLLRLSRI